jgi:4-amino-4-deoxychorismate lyase
MILVNGLAHESISVLDRGLSYGDGVFRTFELRDGKPRGWNRQYRKLREDCRVLSIDCPAQADFDCDIRKIASAHANAVLKLIVTRGAGGRGYALPEAAAVNRMVMTFPLPDYPAAYREQGIKARVCELRLSRQPRLAGIKHLNRLENVLARAEWNDPEIAEGVLLDCDDGVIEGIVSNVFVVENRVLLTPDLSGCGVAGVSRERILESAEKQNMLVRIERLNLSRLLAAEEVFVTNSVIGAWQIRELQGKHWGKGKIISMAQQWLDEPND